MKTGLTRPSLGDAAERKRRTSAAQQAVQACAQELQLADEVVKSEVYPSVDRPPQGSKPQGSGVFERVDRLIRATRATIAISRRECCLN